MWKCPSCFCKILAFATPQKKLGPSKTTAKKHASIIGKIEITQQSITGAYQTGCSGQFWFLFVLPGPKPLDPAGITLFKLPVQTHTFTLITQQTRRQIFGELYYCLWISSQCKILTHCVSLLLAEGHRLHSSCCRGQSSCTAAPSWQWRESA